MIFLWIVARTVDTEHLNWDICIEVDVTDFSKIDYPALIKELCDLVEE